MKINSNTIKLEKESYEKLETIIKKIAQDNKIENVSSIEIKLSKENGTVKFAIVKMWSSITEHSPDDTHTPVEILEEYFEIDTTLAEECIKLIDSPKKYEEASRSMERVNELIGGQGVEFYTEENIHPEPYNSTEETFGLYLIGGPESNIIFYSERTGKFYVTSMSDYIYDILNYEYSEKEWPSKYYRDSEEDVDYLRDKERDDRMDFDKE